VDEQEWKVYEEFPTHGLLTLNIHDSFNLHCL